MFRFSARYFLLTTLLFIIEVLIAIYVNDKFIRPYVGDYLVVILIYCFVMSFVSTPVVKTAVAVLLFSFLVEALQYFNIVEHLGLQHNKMARIVIGSSFAWEDIIAYVLGIVTVIVIEKNRSQVQNT